MDDGGLLAESVSPAHRGLLHPYSLRYLDSELEQRYQLELGEKGRAGFQIAALASAILWAVAIPIVPTATRVPRDVALAAAGFMIAASLICFFFGRRETALDRQQFAVSWLTACNGTVIMVMAASSGEFEGYAVAAVLVLFTFGYVTGTRFIFAAMRTAVISLVFGVIVIVYEARRGLGVDIFLFVAAAVGNVLALHMAEKDRRHRYHQQIVISEQSTELQVRKEESDRLLLNVLPASVSERLKRGESPIADSFDSVSVLFADIQGFTPFAARLSAAEVTAMLSELFIKFDDLVASRGLEKIKTIGDEYMAAGGVPDPMEDHAFRVVDLGLEMIDSAKVVLEGTGLTLRVGVNSGPASGGVIGHRKFSYDVWGTTVNIASRLESTGISGRVQVSRATRELTNGGFGFESRGGVDLPGLGIVETFLVASRLETGS